MDNIDLDFLNSPPKCSTKTKRLNSPTVYGGIDVGFRKKKTVKKSLELAQSIAKVDELLNEIFLLKGQKTELQKQLKDFQTTAKEVQQLYIKEKEEHETIKKSFIELKVKYEEIDADLTNSIMVGEQMKARLAEYEGRPVNFNTLVVKYVNLMNKLDGDDLLKYSYDKDLLEKLKDYCCSMKLKISPNQSPKKHPTHKKCKVKTEEAYVQCNLYEKFINSSNIFQCTSCLQDLANKNVKAPTEFAAVQCNLLEESKSRNGLKKDQMTQCFTSNRDQSSQYISTMITRQTNTEKIIRKHVQTMFPEPQPEPPIDVILNTYSNWSRIRSVSPLQESPQRLSTQRLLKTFNSAGTCTMLCNIRRKIDYLPPNNVFNIKQEIITPSASPTPNAQRLNTSRQCNATLSNPIVNTNNLRQQSTLLNLFNSTTNTSTMGELTFNTFNELWQIFGKILLSLLTSSAGIANAHLNSTVNQQQFIDWLLDLYVSSHSQATIATQTETTEETVPITVSSPVRFNDNATTGLSPNVVRPQAQMAQRANSKENDNEEIQRSTVTHFAEYPNNVANEEEFPVGHNTMDTVVQQTHTLSNCKKMQNDYSKPSLDDNFCTKETQVSITLDKLMKKKHKALKRLLKKTFHHRKKLRKNKKEQSINVVNSESQVVEIPNDNSVHIETAVDFLQMLSNFQPNENCFEENMTKNEKIHKEDSKMDNENDFNFVKPSKISPKKHTKLASSSKDTILKPTKNIKKSKSIDHRLLFGDTDSDDDDVESEFDIQNKKPVIKSIEKLSQSTSLDCKNDVSSNFFKSSTVVANNDNHHVIVKEESTKDHLNLANLPTSALKYNFVSLTDLPSSASKQLKSANLKDLPLPDKVNEVNAGNISNKLNEILKPLDDDADQANANNKESSANGNKRDEFNSTESNAIISEIEYYKESAKSPINDTSTNSLPILNEDDSELHESNFDVKSIQVTYASDFEKDFELSSDNESSMDDNGDNMTLEKQDNENVIEISTNNENKATDNESVFNTITNSTSKVINEPDCISNNNQLIKEAAKIESKENKNVVTDSLQQSSSLEETNSLCASVITISDSNTNFEDTFNETNKTVETNNNLPLNIENYSPCLRSSKSEDIKEVHTTITSGSSTTCNSAGNLIIEYHAQEDKNYLDDSFSHDNSLVIVEDTDAREDTGQSSSFSSDVTLNTSDISPLINVNINADDILKADNVSTPPKKAVKRKSESMTELQPRKRSQRLEATQMILESSLNLSLSPIKTEAKIIDISSYKDENHIENQKHLAKNIFNTDLSRNVTEINELEGAETNLQLGFFKEWQPEETNTTIMLPQDDKMSDMPNDNVVRDNINQKPKTYTVQTEIKTPPKKIEIETDMDESFIKYYDSPISPKPEEGRENNSANALVNIPTERLPQYIPKKDNQILPELLVNSYNITCQKEATQSLTTKERKQQSMILNELEKHITQYCYNEMELNSDSSAGRLTNNLLCICSDYKTIYKSLIMVSQKVESTQTPEKDLPSIIQEMPPRHLSKCMQSLLAVIRNFVKRNPKFCLELMEEIESVLFRSIQEEKFGLEPTLNLTQLYLMTCKVQEETIGLQKNPLRLFIAKCLYYYVQKAILIIHEVLMWYPTVLPYREDKTYDRSDALITVIQYILMNTKYDMDKSDLRSKTFLSKLRYEYHYEPFKPKAEEVASVLVDKIRNNKFHNLFLSFSILCKRLGIKYTQNIMLLQHLLPLAQEYYRLALQTNEFDICIANLLEIISIILKPFPFNTDVSLYLNEFSRFLHAFERPIIQEAALCSILRLQRFGVEECYNAIQNFQPKFELRAHTQAMLKTFAYRRPLTYWLSKQSKNSL